MSHGESRVRARRIRAGIVAGALSLATIAGALVAVAPADASPARVVVTPRPTVTPTAPPTQANRPVGSALVVQFTGEAILTLPAGDGLRDRVPVRVRSGKPGLVDVDAVRGKKTVVIASRVSLRSTAAGWQRTVSVPLRTKGLIAGGWRIRVQRSTDRTVQARSSMLRVGTGAAVHVAVRPAVRTLYPWKDGVLDSALVTVAATDETGAVVPATGTIRIDAGKKHVAKRLGAAQSATLPITALPLGAATVTAIVTGRAGAKAVRTTGLTLAATGVGTSRIARSSDTVQPVVDGLLDSVVLTTTGAASAGSPAKVSGFLTITKGKVVAATFAVPDGAQHAFTWNGRVAGRILPGTYTATLSMRGPQGLIRTTTKTLLVLKSHLPYAVQELFTVAAGNQQGLAVRNGSFYVGYDIGNDQSRIDLYDSSGQLMRSLGPLPVPHVAELAYSTTTGMLYAANGGATTATRIWVIDPTDPQWGMESPSDPTAVIRDSWDLSGLGNNGMVAVDDVNKRLLVFSGSTGAFTVTPVSMTPVTTTNDDGTTTVVTPAGTPGQSVPIAITGVPQGLDLVGQQLWVYTSLKKVNHIAKYDLNATSLLTASAASGGSDLYWGGEGEGMATVAATDTNDGLPAWIFVGAHDPDRAAPNHIGALLPVADE